MRPGCGGALLPPTCRDDGPHAARPPNRPAGAATMRRTRPVKRASAGLSPVRAGAALAMLLCAFAIYGVASSPAFEFDELRIEGATYTDPDAVQGILEEARGENLFRLSTAPLAASLRQLPTVADARIGLGLPGTITVTLLERQPVLVWKVGSQRHLVDRDGLIVGQLGDDASPEAAQPAVGRRRALQLRVAPDGQPPRPGRRRRSHAPRVAEPCPDRELRPQAGSRGHRRPRVTSSGRSPRAGPRSSASTRRASGARTSFPARCACSAACSRVARHRSRRSCWPTSTTGRMSRGRARRRRQAQARMTR